MIAHWDEVAAIREGGAVWRDLGGAAACVGVGVFRVHVDPGAEPVALHSHSAVEEMFFVLDGSGLIRVGDRAYALRPSDCAAQRSGSEPAALRAGSDGLDLLAFTARVGVEVTYLPRARALGVGGRWVDESVGAWERETAAGPVEFPEPEGERPASIVNLDTVERFWEDNPSGFRGSWRDLGRAAGSVQTGLKHQWVEARNRNCPHHVHSAEEEVFVVLEGDGTLELRPAPTGWRHEQEDIPVRAGHVVSRPPGTRLAHAFRAGDRGLTLLAYGTRDPSDIAYQVHAQKLYFRGVGVWARVEPLDYWDGVT